MLDEVIKTILLVALFVDTPPTTARSIKKLSCLDIFDEIISTSFLLASLSKPKKAESPPKIVPFTFDEVIFTLFF